MGPLEHDAQKKNRDGRRGRPGWVSAARNARTAGLATQGYQVRESHVCLVPSPVLRGEGQGEGLFGGACCSLLVAPSGVGGRQATSTPQQATRIKHPQEPLTPALSPESGG